MTNGTQVSLADLRKALTQLLDAVERQHGPTVDLKADYYWTIGPADAFRFDITGCPEPTVGTLTDDVQSMRDILKTTHDEPIAVWHDLAHVIGILNRLAALDLPGTVNGRL
ncbi:hypothetical protein GCM10009827_094280 [Dactylosporangium maewongense]|uniref:Uncharacterized protein n=1 Tax=Dactylosporangium maewongense TaxID=634393 RepID=A0ABP4NC99_9ACTN